MLKALLSIVSLLFLSTSVFAQEYESDVLIIIDDLRYQWDDEAVNLETFEGMEKYCYQKKYKKEIADLLNSIHHYDTLLYSIVAQKHSQTEDLQAKEALKDILIVESEYTTLNFLEFLNEECVKVKKIEKSESKHSNGADTKRKKLEKELVEYIDSVTERIDLIDENTHHLR